MGKIPIHWEEYQWRSNPLRTEVPKYYLELRKPKTARKETNVPEPVEPVSSGHLSDRGPTTSSISIKREQSQLDFYQAKTPRRNRIGSVYSVVESVSSESSSPPPETKPPIELKRTGSLEQRPGPFEQKPTTRSPRNIAAERATMERLCQPQKLPFYATEEYKKIHYNPSLRPSTLEYSGFLPLLQGCTSACPAVQVLALNICAKCPFSFPEGSASADLDAPRGPCRGTSQTP